MFEYTEHIYSILILIGGGLAAIVIFGKNLLDFLLKLREFRTKKDVEKSETTIHMPTEDEVKKYSKIPPAYKWGKISVVEFFIAIAVLGIFFKLIPETDTITSIEGTENSIEIIEDEKKNEEVKDLKYETCRDKSFGIESWSNREKVTQSSGWVGGGSNPQNWCNTLINSSVRGRSIGAEHKTTVLDSGEESKKDWKGYVEYNYRCTISIEWNPIYKQGKSSLCGIEK